MEARLVTESDGSGPNYQIGPGCAGRAQLRGCFFYYFLYQIYYLDPYRIVNHVETGTMELPLCAHHIISEQPHLSYVRKSQDFFHSNNKAHWIDC